MPLSLSTLNAAVDAMKVEASSVQAGVDTLSQKCTSSCNILGTAGSTFGDAIKETAREVEKTIGDALKGLGGISASISESIGKVEDIIKNLKSRLSKLTASAINKITEAMSKMTSAITDVKDSISSGALGTAFTDITNGLTAIANDIKTAIGGVLKGSCSVTLDALKGLGAGASAEVDKIKGAISSAAGNITGTAEAVAGQVGSNLPTLPATGKEAQNIATSLVGDNMKSSLGSLSSSAGSLNDTIGGLTKSAGGAIDSALSQLKKFLS